MGGGLTTHMDRGFQHGIEVPEYSYRQDGITVFSPHAGVTEEVAGDSPDEVGYLAELGILQVLLLD